MSRLPLTSRVLLRADGYRQLHRLWQDQLRSSAPILAALERAIDLRDIATLYEVWAFFALAQRISSLKAQPFEIVVRTTDEKGLLHEVQAEFSNGERLRYNHEYARWSLPYRPDFLWETSQLSCALDAKFRLDSRDVKTLLERNEVVDDEDDPSEDATQQRRRMNRADIGKMHAYRDALGVRAAVVVYPGTETVAYHTDGTREVAATDVLERLLRGDLHGVGAVPLVPETTKEI